MHSTKPTVVQSLRYSNTKQRKDYCILGKFCKYKDICDNKTPIPG